MRRRPAGSDWSIAWSRQIDCWRRSESLLRSILEQGPLAVRSVLECVETGYDLSVDQALLLEANHFGLLSATADMREGTAAFLEEAEARVHRRSSTRSVGITDALAFSTESREGLGRTSCHHGNTRRHGTTTAPCCGLMPSASGPRGHETTTVRASFPCLPCSRGEAVSPCLRGEAVLRALRRLPVTSVFDACCGSIWSVYGYFSGLKSWGSGAAPTTGSTGVSQPGRPRLRAPGRGARAARRQRTGQDQSAGGHRVSGPVSLLPGGGRPGSRAGRRRWVPRGDRRGGRARR